MELIKVVENELASGKEHVPFGIGDTISVSYRIREGAKERIQVFRGDVIKFSGNKNKRRFTVRKISNGVGVERIFPIDSPFIESIQVHKRGRVRRAKLYYLRERTGKSARIRERYIAAAKAQEK